MSIASEIIRIGQLRNRMASKLWELGIADTSTLTLQQCKEFVDAMGGTQLLTSTSLTNVARYKYAQISDPNLTADNIKKKTTILGVAGLYNNQIPTTQLDSTCNIVYGVKDPPPSVYYPASGKHAFPAIAFTKPADSCANMTLRPENIKEGVSILGVNGTYQYTTMKAGHRGAFNSSSEGNYVGVSTDQKSITWALLYVTGGVDPPIPPTDITTDTVQQGWVFITTNPWHAPDFSGYYVIRADFGISKYTGNPYMTVDVLHRTWIGADKIYRLLVDKPNPYRIEYHVDNDNVYRSYLTLELGDSFKHVGLHDDAFYNNSPEFTEGDNVFWATPSEGSYHMDVRW